MFINTHCIYYTYLFSFVQDIFDIFLDKSCVFLAFNGKKLQMGAVGR